MQDSDDEDEQAHVAAKAQVLMNCAADMVRQHGIEAFSKMHDLHILVKRDAPARTWNITGRLPDALGGGAYTTILPCESIQWVAAVAAHRCSQ